jgi:hypothetical protein
LNDKPTSTIKRKLRITYAKRETGVKGNFEAAKTRVKNKLKKSTPSAKTMEGKRATKDKSGGSGFKIGKKRGKMRFIETKS